MRPLGNGNTGIMSVGSRDARMERKGKGYTVSIIYALGVLIYHTCESVWPLRDNKAVQ
jgi:hypothetical protein